MGNFLTLVQPTSTDDLYNYRGTGFVKLRHVASVSDSDDDVYTLTFTAASGSNPSKFTFAITSRSLSNVERKTGMTFVIDTTLMSDVQSVDGLYAPNSKKEIRLGSSTIPLTSALKAPGPTPTIRNPIITTGAEYLIVYDGSSFVVMNEAMMVDQTTYNAHSTTANMAAPTVRFMIDYVGEQISTKYTYLVCPPNSDSIPSGAEYKESPTATPIVGSMGVAAAHMYIIYLVLHNIHAGSGDMYDEWICVNTGTEANPSYSWEKIGNTDVNVNHTHDTPLGGAHSHTLQESGLHSHSVTVTPAISTVSSKPAASDVYTTLSVPQAPANTGNAGSHSHMLESAGGHTHTMNSVGAHSHTVTVTPGISTVESKPTSGVYTTLSVPQAPANTGSAGGHSHTIESTGDHKHTMNAVTSHSHSVSVTVDGKLSTSDDGETYGTPSNVVTIEVPKPSADSGEAGGHDHTLQYQSSHSHTVYATNSSHSHTLVSAGEHTHTMDSAGEHTHTFTYAATVDGETLILPISSDTGSGGSHEHTLETVASHTHTMSLGGEHSHTLATSGGHTHTMNAVADHSHSITNGELWRKFIRIETSGSGTTGLAGEHSHTLESTGGHTHTMNAVADHSHTVGNEGTAWTRYIKITTSASSGEAGGHSHTLESTGEHKHTMNVVADHSHTVGNEGTAWTRYIKITTSASSGEAGGHSHTVDSGGTHSHTTGQPIS